MLRAADLSHAQVRQALQALGVDPPAQRAAAARTLREAFAAYGTVRDLVDGAPDDARTAFVELAHHGPLAVEDLLGRGWWGHGALPPPLDWLQQRGLVAAGDDGLVHAVAEARAAFTEQALPLPEAPAAGAQGPPGQPGADGASEPPGAGAGDAADSGAGDAADAGAGDAAGAGAGDAADAGAGDAAGAGAGDAADAGAAGGTAGAPGAASDEAVRVEEAGCVLVADHPAALDRALTVTDAELRGVAATVAVSPKPAAEVGAALRAAGVRLADDALVAANPGEPALPDAAEEAVGPRAVRTLLERAVTERRQVWLHYFASSRGGAATERVVDPWSFGEDLLRGHCHLRRGERTFAVDRIGRARLLPSGLEYPAPGR